LIARPVRVRGLRSGTVVPKARATRYGLPRNPSSASISKFALMIQLGLRIWVAPSRYCQWLAFWWNSGDPVFRTVSAPRETPSEIVVMPEKTSCAMSRAPALAV